MPITEILHELHKRRQGYLFSGPTPNWCQPHIHKEKYIEINGKKFSGCTKYASCDQIEETIKWTNWEYLTKEQKLKLKGCHCYRASAIGNKSIPYSLWDVTYIPERINTSWIGNPFGIRKIDRKFDSPKNDFFFQRDKNPCKIGGCLTPEMQAEYITSTNSKLSKTKSSVTKYWKDMKACPYFYRAKDEKFDTFEKNISRFAQCYVTQQDIRNLLQHNGFITAAPLFREQKNDKKLRQDIFWYPFFSGYSYVQLLYNVNNDRGWQRFSPQLRWHATSIQRVNVINSENKYLPKTQIAFSKCEEDEYQDFRFWDICDGYASWYLLTWILIQRYNIGNSIDPNFDNKKEWKYENGVELYKKLKSLGFENELQVKLNIKIDKENTIRKSSLNDDLQLLGLYRKADGNKLIPTKRFDYLITWLKKGKNEDTAELDHFNKLKTKILQNVTLTKEIFLNYFNAYVQSIITTNCIEKFYDLNLLNPPVHLIVRAFLSFPIRWCFIPFNTDLNESIDSVLPTSATILLLEDSLESKAYKPSISEKENVILKRINNIFPLLSAVNTIEEQNLRDEQEKKRKEIEVEKDKQATRAAISQVMARNMSHNIGSHVLSRLLIESQISMIYKENQNGVTYQCKNDIEKTKIKSNNELIADFFSYLKSRMDFLADITTSTPVIENIKDSYNEIVSSFLRNRVLNDRISGIEEFSYKIIVCNPKQNSNNINCIDNNSNKCQNLLDGNRNTDIQVSIPNDVLGNHAFYTILENIIRNTAKHGGTNGDLQFHIKIEDSSNLIHAEFKTDKNIMSQLDELYAISIFDNFEIKGNVRIDDFDEKDKKKYQLLFVEGKTEIPKLTKLVFDQNERLNESILNEEGKLRLGAWGLIEMDASAAYLRKIPVEQIDSDDYQINLLDDSSIISSSISNKHNINILKAYSEQNKYLGYRFFLYKPRDILIIGEDSTIFGDIDNEEIDANKKRLKKTGIWIENNIDEKKVYPHKLVVITSEYYGNNNIKIENNPCLSRRILVYSEKDLFLKMQDPNVDFKLFLISFFYNSKESKSKTKCAQISPVQKERLEKMGAVINQLEICSNYTYLVHGEGYCSKRNRFDFIEIQSSITSNFFSQEKIGINLLLQLLSWPVKIKVIDERIQHASKGKYHIQKTENCEQKPKPCFCEDGVPFEILYKKTNILVPSASDGENGCDLNKQNFNTEYEKIIAYIKNDINEMEFIVIHLGIIEKLISSHNAIKRTKYSKETGADVKKFVCEIICNNGDRNEYGKLIITSGRGVPNNLPDDIRYLNFSIVSQYMIDLRNKFAFTEALFCARKITKN